MRKKKALVWSQRVLYITESRQWVLNNNASWCCCDINYWNPLFYVKAVCVRRRQNVYWSFLVAGKVVDSRLEVKNGLRFSPQSCQMKSTFAYKMRECLIWKGHPEVNLDRIQCFEIQKVDRGDIQSICFP